MMFVLGIVLGAIASFVVSLFGTVLLQDWATGVLARIVGDRLFIRRPYRLSGEYIQTWNADTVAPNEGTPAGGESIAYLKQFANRLIGTFTFDGHEFRLRGRIHDGSIVSGEWIDVNRGYTYHGVFQFRVETHTRTLTGRWLGFSRNGPIRSGDWKWRPVNPSESHGLSVPSNTPTV